MQSLQHVVLSGRKKNYLGVTNSGKVDVKGLTGKKSHTPPFIKTLFYELLDILAEVKNVEGFDNAKKKISDKITEYVKKVEAKEIPLSELAFNVMIFFQALLFLVSAHYAACVHNKLDFESIEILPFLQYHQLAFLRFLI